MWVLKCVLIYISTFNQMCYNFNVLNEAESFVDCESETGIKSEIFWSVVVFANIQPMQ